MTHLEETAMTTPSTAPAVRTLGGVPLPAPGPWQIDPGHAEVAFIGRHFMLTKVRGRFTDVTGTVRIAENPAESRVDVAAHPTATFRSTGVDWRGTDATVHGDLTIHGVTRPVPLEVSFLGVVRDPWGNDRAVFSACTRINREDFGLTWNMVLETGGLLVSKEIQIEIEVETIRG